MGLRTLEAAINRPQKRPPKGKMPRQLACTNLWWDEQKAFLAMYEDPTPNKTKWGKKLSADLAGSVKKKIKRK